jgi:hypothetical protein
MSKLVNLALACSMSLPFLAVMAMEAQALHRGGGIFGGSHCACHSECGHAIGCRNLNGCGSTVSEDSYAAGDYNDDLDNAEREQTQNRDDAREKIEFPASDRNPGEESEGGKRPQPIQGDSANGHNAATSSNESAVEAPRQINHHAKTSSENVQGNPQR